MQDVAPLVLLCVPAAQHTQVRSAVAFGAVSSCCPGKHVITAQHDVWPALGWCVSAALHPHLRVRMRNTFAFCSGAGPGFCAKANLFAVTTDHEKAIESGLEASALKLLTHRISCSLHAFWSK